jgi:hypothetical protein
LATVGLLYGEWVFRLVRAELRLTLSLAKNSEQIGEARNDRAAQLLGRHWASERAAYCRLLVCGSLLETATISPGASRWPPQRSLLCRHAHASLTARRSSPTGTDLRCST